MNGLSTLLAFRQQRQAKMSYQGYKLLRPISVFQESAEAFEAGTRGEPRTNGPRRLRIHGRPSTHPLEGMRPYTAARPFLFFNSLTQEQAQGA